MEDRVTRREKRDTNDNADGDQGERELVFHERGHTENGTHALGSTSRGWHSHFL